MIYEQWDKQSPVNGVEAIYIIGKEQMENDDPFIIFSDENGIIAIESYATIKQAYGLTGNTVDDVASEYITLKTSTVKVITESERIEILESALDELMGVVLNG